TFHPPYFIRNMADEMWRMAYGVWPMALRTNDSLPVFYDPAGRRSRFLLRFSWPLAAIVTLLPAILIASVLINPALPRLNLRQISSRRGENDTRPKTPRLATKGGEKTAARARGGWRGALNKPQFNPPAPAALANQPSARPLALGFYVNWDDSSYQSLKLH